MPPLPLASPLEAELPAAGEPPPAAGAVDAGLPAPGARLAAALPLAAWALLGLSGRCWGGAPAPLVLPPERLPEAAFSGKKPCSRSSLRSASTSAQGVGTGEAREGAHQAGRTAEGAQSRGMQSGTGACRLA